jgi:uncharacterized membrane protein YdjX (TVP38/TMEM64 family)
MKRFLTLTAIIESATGLALIAVPAIVVRLLLGAEISGASIPLGRVAGAALLALGVACWLARDDTQSRAARGLVVAMLIYNIVATAVLAFAGIGLGLHGVVLWPAVVLHAAMGVWCITTLLKAQAAARSRRDNT